MSCDFRQNKRPDQPTRTHKRDIAVRARGQERDGEVAVANKVHAEGMFDALDLLGFGAALVDRNGRVLLLNREARTHVGHSLEIVDGHLTASDRAEKKKLQGLIDNVDASSEAAARGPRAIMLSRRRGRPLIAYLAVDQATRDSLRPGEGIVLFMDPDMVRELPPSLLQQAFSLTPAEMRLAQGLAKGQDLQSIARRHNLSVGTLRVQLRSVFAKTHTKRQGELLMLLARLAIHSRH
jgi:DNA-binding CsgD family transcriptional regulator